MALSDALMAVENWPLSQEIGGTIWYPVLESLHVLAAVFVVGSLLSVDVRLLGWSARSQAVTRLSGELLPWTWGAFVIAVLTGIGLFLTRASAFFDNTAMQFKALALLLAGINMGVFHFGAYRGIARWDAAAEVPLAAKVAGGASLLLWSAVMLAGRWIGHLI